jgi:hypothetical protein
MSGYNEEHEGIDRALAGRPQRLLQKPFHIDLLAAQLRAALDMRTRSRLPQVS